ncbi:MAG: hypothetical protein ACLQPH_22325 [Acidimicrobiales bacterium]
MADPHEPHGNVPLNQRLLDLFVFVPAGIAVSVVEELPEFAARGREALGVRVSSARAVGHFVVRAGHDELRRRSEGLRRRPASPPSGQRAPTSGWSDREPAAAPTRPSAASRRAPHRPVSSVPAPEDGTPRAANGHVPAVSTLSIPGFDTLSASQVVQRLDGLNRSELVSVRAYEASNRGRRTILSRVDQLLDERS